MRVFLLLALAITTLILILNVVLASSAGNLKLNEEEESEIFSEVHSRWKRDDSSGSTGWKIPGSGLLRKAKKLLASYKSLPPNLKEAIEGGDFSNVTTEDIKNVNVTVLEYIPTKVFEKAKVPLLSAFIDKFLNKNRPNAVGRLVEAAGAKLDTNYLLDKLTSEENKEEKNNEASAVLLYNAVSRVGDKGITEDLANRLVNNELLKEVPEEQLMKVKEPRAAITLLNAFQNLRKGKDADAASHVDNTDDNSLLVKLVETGFGPANTWTRDSLQYLNIMPAAFLKNLKPELVKESITHLAGEASTPLQAKAISDVYMANNQIPTTHNGVATDQTMTQWTEKLGKLSAFLPASLTKNPDILKTIINSCEQMNLPAPIQAVSKFFQEKLKGSTKLTDLTGITFQGIPASVLKNSPPEILKVGMDEKSIQEETLTEIGETKEGGGKNSFFQGVISQLSSYAVQLFGGATGNTNLRELPAAFFGALGIKGIDFLRGNKIEEATNKVKENPDALDDIQKALLIKKGIDAGAGEDIDLPPEFLVLKPRKKGEVSPEDILGGLPSDSELRLAFGSETSAAALLKYPKLIGTLTPKQVGEIDLEDIPAVLAVIRKSKDGPQSQTLKALHTRFIEYIRLKSDDYETEDDKKLLKHLTAAEVSKLPATVLAYFIDHRQTGKLPAAVRKEIMIAMGELSTKDHAIIPAKTRDEIILQGLAALDAQLDAEKKYDVAELAALHQSVVDLPADKIERLTPIAFEQALEIVQGTADDDDDGLKQRACLKPEQRKAWRAQIVKNYGAPETWSPSTVSILCCSLELLTEDDLTKLSGEAVAACKCASDLAPPSHLADLKKSLENNCKHELGNNYNEGKKTFDKIKSERSLDIEDLESQILTNGRKRRETHNHVHNHENHAERELNCYALRLAGSAARFDSRTLETLDPKEIPNCLYELGVEKLTHENARILWRKLVQSYETVEKIPSESLRLANHVLNGISESDVAKLDFSNMDIVASFGRPLGLSKNILKKMAVHLEEVLNYQVNNFGVVQLMTARNILCGFEHDKLSTININNFREALPILRSIEPTCEQTRLAALVNLAASPEVFGEISEWNAADVRGIGNLIKGMTTEAKSIPPEAFLGITPAVAETLTDTLKELTPEQLSFFPTFAARSMTDEQFNLLSEEGKASLEQTKRGPLVADHSSNFKSSSCWTILSITLIFVIGQMVIL